LECHQDYDLYDFQCRKERDHFRMEWHKERSHECGKYHEVRNQQWLQCDQEYGFQYRKRDQEYDLQCVQYNLELKSVFNFSWSLPKIKLPHFSITGSFSLNPPSIPHFSVDWYKKAMSGGMILKDATIFGQSGGTLLGGGEAGDEAVVGVSSLRSMIQDAVSSATLSVSGDQPLINIGEMSVRSDDDIRKISQQLNTLLTAGRRAKGLV
jgi:hypothetical protein